ncbi:ASKHA domain-containing protein [Candidatus Bathyarchaeota archaeon]|nr:ASKHA domain-containing protein [Candidatus Bathyarchaeota archaeon]
MTAYEDIVVEIPKETRLGARRIQASGTEKAVKLDLLVTKHHVVLSKPTISDVRPDTKRIFDALSSSMDIRDLEIDYDLLKKLPNLLRDYKWNFTITTWKKRIIAIDEGNTTSTLYGLAVDLGTSKIVLILVNLKTGETQDSESIENPQLVHGEDLISRIAYAMDSDSKHLMELQGLIVKGINKLLSEICDRNGVSCKDIHEMVIVGNTAMLQFFLAVPPKYMALAPYVPALKQGLNIEANKLSIEINPVGNVHVLPVIAGFVGADAVADVLSSGMYDSSESSLLIDIGTNGEIILGNKDGLVSCSCAAGPAFEGGHIEHGMKAYTGAIEKIKIDAENHKVEYTTIGGEKPIGICGSGMIDLIAEMSRSGVINYLGRMNKSAQKRPVSNQEFLIASREESGIAHDITVSGKDIDEIMLAKAAVQSGWHILMKQKNLSVNDLKKIYIAGAFGNYINTTSAKIIGLIPNAPDQRIRLIGNAALSGAKMALVSNKMRNIADEISKKIDYVELSTVPGFEMEYAKSLRIPRSDNE